MIVLDTTVLVYAVGAEHPLREPCRALIERIAEGRIAATTTVEVIQELAHVRARRCGREDASQLARHYALLLKPLLRPDADELAAGLQLFGTHRTLGCFDAVLAATALRHGATAIVSADRAFSEVDGLAHRDPGATTFLAWLQTTASA